MVAYELWSRLWLPSVKLGHPYYYRFFKKIIKKNDWMLGWWEGWPNPRGQI